jgi:hypothetical protein
MKPIGIAAAALVLLSSLTAAAQEPPAGWDARRSGNEIIIRPRQLPAGQLYALGIEADIDIAGRSVRDWFTAMLDSEGAKLGELVVKGEIVERAGTIGVTRVYRNAAGLTLTAVLTAMPQPDKRVRLVAVVCTAESCRAHGDAGLQWMKARLRELDRAGGADAAQGERERPTRKRFEPPPPYRTAPGRGLRPSQVDSVVFRRLVSGRVAPVVLLENGEYCTYLDVPPEDMDMAAHKKENAGAWGRWRRRGGAIETLQGGKHWIEERDWGEELRPARPSEALSGTFTRGYGHGTMQFLDEIAFSPDGRFARRKSANVALAPSTAGVGGGKGDRGSYRFNGRTIELRHDDGTVERHAFHWGRAEKDMIFLDNHLYSLDD